MRKLVIASGNPGKLHEMSALLEPLDYEVHPQSEFDVPDVEETGTTFVENAIIKARNAAQHTGLPAIADDSGIEVDALNGAPGVYSARFAGADATDEKNNALLVQKLRDVPPDERGARYRAVLVFMRHAADPSPIICEGSWAGSIVLEARGTNGFGYDPHFWVADQQCTSAELPAATKNSLSHRGQALARLVKRLQA